MLCKPTLTNVQILIYCIYQVEKPIPNVYLAQERSIAVDKRFMYVYIYIYIYIYCCVVGFGLFGCVCCGFDLFVAVLCCVCFVLLVCLLSFCSVALSRRLSRCSNSELFVVILRFSWQSVTPWQPLASPPP